MWEVRQSFPPYLVRGKVETYFPPIRDGVGGTGKLASRFPLCETPPGAGVPWQGRRGAETGRDIAGPKRT